jgi:uncharacterized protein involved in outer membrane biogenesis
MRRQARRVQNRSVRSLTRTIVTVAAIVLLGVFGLFIWAQTVLTGDTVRLAVERQLTQTLGQPVHVSSVHATVVPRVTMTLAGVTIGGPASATIERVFVGTNIRALLSRRIEHAAIRVADARIASPASTAVLRSLAGTPPAGRGASIEIRSIDTIALTNVQLVNGARMLRIDGALAVDEHGLRIQQVSLNGDDGTSVEISGTIADLGRPAGQLTVKGKNVNVLGLLPFAAAFSGGVTEDTGRGSSAPDLAMSVQADRAIIGTLTLADLTGHGRVADGRLMLDPIAFGVMGGTSRGSLSWTLTRTPLFHVNVTLAGLDAAAVVAFAGSDGVITGRLAGSLNLQGRGTSVDDAISSAHGPVRLDIEDGTIDRLGLVRTLVLATSMREDSRGAVNSAAASDRESFSHLGATFTVADAVARTNDLSLTSRDVLLSATGQIGFRTQAVDLNGRAQLSDELSKQAGRDLVRYTREDGRVTLPVTISGTPGNLHVRVDLAAVAGRALKNRAEDAIKKGLGQILK